MEQLSHLQSRLLTFCFFAPFFFFFFFFCLLLHTLVLLFDENDVHVLLDSGVALSKFVAKSGDDVDCNFRFLVLLLLVVLIVDFRSPDFPLIFTTDSELANFAAIVASFAPLGR